MAYTRRSDQSSGGGRPKGGRPRYVPRRRVCAFCADKSKVIDFRDALQLRRYLSDRAKIDSRRKTATCSKHQRQLALAIKRARHLALLPYTLAHIRQTGFVGFRSPTPRPPHRMEPYGVQHAPPSVPPAAPPAAVPAAAAPAATPPAQETAQAKAGPAAGETAKPAPEGQAAA